METTEIQPALASAVEEVLETMCFTSVLASTEGGRPAGEDAAPQIRAALQFAGNPPGGFEVSVSLGLARTLGAGFLGLDETEVSDSQAADVVCELSNMICGSVLSRLESGTMFRISHPELAGSDAGSGSAPSASRWFDLGDGILSVALRLEERA
jgi:CheY-specific phosphatase CheX